MSYGMDGWNHDNDLVRRKDVMDSLTKEYNDRKAWKTGGLQLAWIEKAVNDVPAAQQGKIQLPEEAATKGETSDLISREAALNALSRGSGCGTSCHRAIKALPSAQPDKSRVEDCLYHIRRNTSSHTSAEGVVAIKHYMGELWRELFGEEDVPEWMI